ncbi:DUF2163 domain-containing protein [Enterovirga sp.]|uniref:DUF2163 domain-containing protein n=1 Tax=Enterovirga sp. TaxID=2026350 RepID=UPI00263866A1|nr:DUF2163 domain-containing protein [Enterovirga sp.]MDB5592166.1 beta-tubulin [Enterovirga sp.]
MRTIPDPLAAHLAEGVTTLCRCWTLRRRDGVVQGFTDHDRDLVVLGQLHSAATGLQAAEAASELGFAVGGGDVSGALSSSAITEDDILAGRYDDAEVDLRLVNWAEPSQHLLLERASLGEIRRQDDAFVAELRGPLHRLDEERGLIYRATCSADLGDARCRVDLDDPAWRGSGTVAAGDGALRFTAEGLDGFADGRFTGGRLLWTGGESAGLAADVKRHRVEPGAVTVELWQRSALPILPGDAFTVTAGCDKRPGTCRDVFANLPNFRGFPHMPGNDFVLKVALAGEAGLDGQSLFR